MSDDEEEGDPIETAHRILTSMSPMLKRTGAGDNPLRLIGRIAGLGDAQMDAGVPKWSWLGIGLVAGATVVWVWGDQAKAFLRRRRQ
jgi:hypothetical protein